jgi:beta-ketodecanoyl-[acyl-carrier-protein] synthase
MNRVMMSGIGAVIPEPSITNEQLVASFNAWVDAENPNRMLRGEEPLQKSDEDFIVYASGVRKRHVIERDGILDPTRMAPRIAARGDDELSLEAEFGVKSARRALDYAGLEGSDIDMVICAASHHQRPYPAIAIEIQHEIGAQGTGFDMGLGCSSAGAALHIAVNLVRTGAHRRVLVVTPEIITGHLNFRDRQTHFIFGDASASMIVEAMPAKPAGRGIFEVLDTRGWTQFSNNIRTNLGYLSRTAQEDPSMIDMEGNMIKQVGNKVFKEVTHAAHRFISQFLADHQLSPADVRRYWLHQANGRMNAMILKLALGHDADFDRAPTVLDRLGNTAAAGAIVALEENHRDLQEGDIGLLCAFGAGYSIGSALMRRI